MDKEYGLTEDDVVQASVTEQGILPKQLPWVVLPARVEGSGQKRCSASSLIDDVDKEWTHKAADSLIFKVLEQTHFLGVFTFQNIPFRRRRRRQILSFFDHCFFAPSAQIATASSLLRLR